MERVRERNGEMQMPVGGVAETGLVLGPAGGRYAK